MIDRDKLEELSDAFQSTFSVVREDPDVITNLMAPKEVGHVVELIKKHLGWDRVSYHATGQLKPEYDIYFFAQMPSHLGQK